MNKPHYEEWTLKEAKYYCSTHQCRVDCELYNGHDCTISGVPNAWQLPTTQIFISCPMIGKSDDVIRQTFNKALDACSKEYGNVELCNPFEPKVCRTDNAKLRLLGEGLELMSTSDVVYFCKGFEQSRGCMLELHAAHVYGKVCKFESPQGEHVTFDIETL